MALGLLPCLREGAAQLRLELPRCRVAIEGFGQIGASIAELLVRQGCLVTAISDASGGYHHDKGLDVAAAARHLAEHGSLAGFDRVSFAARLSEPAKLLGLPVDVLLTAGRDLTLSGEQALRVQARLVAECARGAIDPIADEVLGGRGVLILPDILCTAGGVTVSYLEWVQNRTGYYWNEARVVEDVERILLESWRKVGRTALEYGVSTRVAAFIVAIDRVTRTSELRGLYA
jgi:glutamate dehydrogenase (NAD(P)+)